MRQLFMVVVLILAVTGVVPGAAAQIPEDVKRLKDEIEILRKKMSNLEKENELLKREIELMKREKSTPEVLKDRKTEAKAGTRASVSMMDFELVKCIRDHDKRERITFTFAVRREEEGRGPTHIGVPKQLKLISSDLKEYKSQFTGDKRNERPNGKIVDAPDSPISVDPEKWVTFQVTFEGVDKEVTEFKQVELIMGAKSGIQRFPAVRFSDIKIESK